MLWRLEYLRSVISEREGRLNVVKYCTSVLRRRLLLNLEGVMDVVAGGGRIVAVCCGVCI